ncbi:MAG: sigma-70 family RNA polymerase sigma factor [Planctomycetota bacterium]
MTDASQTPDKLDATDSDPSPPKSPEEVSDLVEAGQGLVRSLAMGIYRKLPFRMDLDDLIAYGQLGLAEAVQSFDAECGTKFTTFAYYRIRGAIYDGVSKMNWSSRAQYRRMRFQRMSDAVLEGESESSLEGSGDQATDDANWLGRVTEKLAVVYLATSDDEGVSRSLSDAADPHEPPSKVVANRELQSKLRTLVDQLAPDAKRLVSSIYFDGYTLTEAAERLGISKSWASRLHARSLDQLAGSLRRINSE